MALENCLVSCRNPVMMRDGSNRIDSEISEWNVLQNVKMDFSDCLTTDEVRNALERMDKLGFHIMGSRGYIYHSKSLANMVYLIDRGVPMALKLFPRTFGLRGKLKEVSVHEFTQ